MKGVIFKNAYMSFGAYDSQALRIKEELENLGVKTDIIRNGDFCISVDEKVINRLKGYDFCVYLDKDKYVLYGLEKCGVKTFNSRRAIELCDDKMLTHLALAGQGIPMPKTLPAPLCYDKGEKLPEDYAEKIEKELGYPIVIKSCYGSRGGGVHLAKNREQLLKKAEDLKCAPHLYQQFINGSFGRDLRVMVIGGKVLGCTERFSLNGDFRANAALGGSAKAFSLDKEAERMCLSVAEILKLDYCGIDLLMGEDGEKYVCEVNSNAFFEEFERTTKINVAKAYAEYILKTVEKN